MDRKGERQQRGIMRRDQTSLILLRSSPVPLTRLFGEMSTNYLIVIRFVYRWIRLLKLLNLFTSHGWKICFNSASSRVLTASTDAHHNYCDSNTASRVLNNARSKAKCCLLETKEHDTR